MSAAAARLVFLATARRLFAATCATDLGQREDGLHRCQRGSRSITCLESLLRRSSYRQGLVNSFAMAVRVDDARLRAGVLAAGIDRTLRFSPGAGAAELAGADAHDLCRPSSRPSRRQRPCWDKQGRLNSAPVSLAFDGPDASGRLAGAGQMLGIVIMNADLYSRLYRMSRRRWRISIRAGGSRGESGCPPAERFRRASRCR